MAEKVYVVVNFNSPFSVTLTAFADADAAFDYGQELRAKASNPANVSVNKINITGTSTPEAAS